MSSCSSSSSLLLVLLVKTVARLGTLRRLLGRTYRLSLSRTTGFPGLPRPCNYTRYPAIQYTWVTATPAQYFICRKSTRGGKIIIHGQIARGNRPATIYYFTTSTTLILHILLYEWTWVAPGWWSDRQQLGRPRWPAARKDNRPAPGPSGAAAYRPRGRHHPASQPPCNRGARQHQEGLNNKSAKG